eukprot:gene13679-13795_t
MTVTALDEKWLASADFGPAVLRLRLLEVQLILNRTNLSQDIRERARQAADDLRQAIADRPCASRVDLNAKLSLLMEKSAATASPASNDLTNESVSAALKSVA